MAKHFQPGIHQLELSELFNLIRTKKPANVGSREANEWNGYLTLAEALDAAELGKWSAPKIRSVTLPDITGESEETRYFYDVVGNNLDIPAFVAGEPEYWQTEEALRKPCGKVIRLSIEIGGKSLITATELANRGQAIVALINSLEMQGHSVELTIVRAYRNTSDEHYRFLIPVKHAGMAIDMKRIQFMIGHPAFYRMVLFALAEIAHGDTNTWTESFEPGQTTHIRASQGLQESLDNSIRWAQEFAQTLTGN